MLCTCIWNLKTMPVNKWVRSLVNSKSKGKKWLYLRPYLKTFPVFNVLQTCRVHLLTIGLGIVKFIKKLSSGFLINEKFVGMEQITCKNCNKSSWMQVYKIILTRARPEQPSSFLFAVFNGIKPLWDEASFPKLIIILKILANCVDSYILLFVVFLII